MAPGLQVTDDAFRQIEAACLQSSILPFRDLRMTPDQQIVCTQRLGGQPIMPENLAATMPGCPEIFLAE